MNYNHTSVSTLTHSHFGVCNCVRKKDINLSPITAAPLLLDNSRRDKQQHHPKLQVGMGWLLESGPAQLAKGPLSISWKPAKSLQPKGVKTNLPF